MDFFKSEKISGHIIRICDITGVFCYLVTGTEGALLIDTACGIGDLKGFVESLTDLPLTVICTHGHMDHAGGADQFESVYLNPADVELTYTHCTIENRREYTAMAVSALRQVQARLEDAGPDVSELLFAPVRRRPYKPLYPGQEFELGGITVRALPLRGHTQGSMCMLFCEERSILFGDACNPSVFLFDRETSSVEEYREELMKFRQYDTLYDTVWLSHGDGEPVEKRILEDCIEVCDEILAGEDEKAEFRFMGKSYRAAHRMLPSQLRKDGGLANIIYNSDHVRRREE